MNKLLNLPGLYLLAFMLILFSCNHDEDPAVIPDPVPDELPTPSAGFTFHADETNPLIVTFSNTSTDAETYAWDFGDGSDGSSEKSLSHTFAEAGIYEVVLTASNGSESDMEQQTVTVEDLEPASTPNLLTGNGESKTWVLAGAGSIKIGPAEGGVWWELPTEQVEGRACQLNDSFTFHADGTFVYDNQGDIYVEEEGGAAHPAGIGIGIGCHAAADLPAAYAGWGSGTHSYEYSEPQVTLIGTGAFLGIYKAGENDFAQAPEESITYEIVELSADKLIITATLPDRDPAAAYTFTFVPEGTVTDPGDGDGDGSETACTGDEGNAALLTGCGESKAWVLAGAGSIKIGPAGGGTWWELPEEQVAGRTCQLNDQFIFHSDGTFVYDSQGDVYVEEEGGAAHPADIGLGVGCNVAGDLPSTYAAWGSGTHAYLVNESVITVSGTGAFLGIYKAGENNFAEVPEETISYDIVELTPETLVITATLPDRDPASAYTFTFVPAE